MKRIWTFAMVFKNGDNVSVKAISLEGACDDNADYQKLMLNRAVDVANSINCRHNKKDLWIWDIIQTDIF